MNAATEWYSGGLDSSKDGIEIVLDHSKAIMKHRNRLWPFIEVERQPVIEINGRERPHARFRPGNSKEFCQQLRRGYLVTRRHHKVIQFNAHRALLFMRVLGQRTLSVCGTLHSRVSPRISKDSGLWLDHSAVTRRGAATGRSRCP